MEAESLESGLKNRFFGFQVLHQSVQENIGQIEVFVVNKMKTVGGVRLKTIEGAAKAAKDFEPIDELLVFNAGEDCKAIKLKVLDDLGWDPNSDFFIQLLDAFTGEVLEG